MKSVRRQLVFYAPNVHTGGGLVLLKELLDSWPGGDLSLFLDERVRQQLRVPSDARVNWVRPTIKSRLFGELLLWRNSHKNVQVICFHGLPPILYSSGNVTVFLQNRNYITKNRSSKVGLRTALRIGLELLFFRFFRHRVAQYIVQTPSMRDALSQWYSTIGGLAPGQSIRAIPFFGKIPECTDAKIYVWDFIYIADGEAHKNHRNLIQAWEFLAEENIRPSLCLTLNGRYADLKVHINRAIKKYSLEIYDLGEIPRDNAIKQYGKSRALIFPSQSESFGLPLIEANHLSLPILAPEMDYVRDVCIPVETFDPNSPASIARAVKRFLGYLDAPILLKPPSAFWDEVLGELGED